MGKEDVEGDKIKGYDKMIKKDVEAERGEDRREKMTEGIRDRLGGRRSKGTNKNKV